jgi:hypothetical protein
MTHHAQPVWHHGSSKAFVFSKSSTHIARCIRTLFQKHCSNQFYAGQPLLGSPVHDFPALACFHAPAFMQYLYIVLASPFTTS